MHFARPLVITTFGFLFAQFFVLAGVRVVVNGFKFQHLWLGIALMILAYYLDRRGKNTVWMDVFWFGAGIAINDMLFDPSHLI